MRKNNFLYQIFIFFIIVVTLSSVLYYELESKQIQQENFCFPSGMISKDDPNITLSCENFLKLEYISLIIFMIFLSGILFLIIFGIKKSHTKISNNPFQTNLIYRQNNKIDDSEIYQKFQNIYENILLIFNKIWKKFKYKEKLIVSFPYIVILFFSLIVWRIPDIFNEGFILLGDSQVFLSNFAIKNSLLTEYYLWNNSGTGFYNPGTGFHFLYYVFVWFLDIIHFPLWLINRILFILPSIVIGFSCFYFSKSLITGRRSTFICTTVAIFAVFAPTHIFQNPILELGFAGVPLMIAYFINGLKNKNKTKFVLLLALSSVLVAFSPFALLITLGILGIWLVGHLLKKPNISELKFPCYSLILIFLVNFYWIFSILSASQGSDIISTIYSQEAQLGGLGLLENVAPYTSLFYVSRLFYNVENGLSNYFQASPIIMFFSFLLPLFAYSSLIRKGYTTKLVVIISVILTLLATGLHYDFLRGIYLWMWENLPFFKILNNPTYFLSILTFFYAVMIGFTTQNLLERIDKAKKRNLLKLKFLVIFTVFALILINGGMTLNLLNEGNEYTTHYAILTPPAKIPSSYQNLLEYLEDDDMEGFRLLNLPFNSYVQYRWQDPLTIPLASGILPNFSTFPIIGIAPDIKSDNSEANLIEALSEGKTSTAILDMRNFNIKYILVNKDFLGNHWGNTHPNYPQDFLHYVQIFERSPDIFERILETNEFNLYKINHDILLQKFFTFNSSQIEKFELLTFDGPVCPCFTISPSDSFSLNTSFSFFAWIKLDLIQKNLDENYIIANFGTEKKPLLQIDSISNKLGVSMFDDRTYFLDYEIIPGDWYFVGITVDENFYSVYAKHHGFPPPPERLTVATSFEKMQIIKDLPLNIGHAENSFFNGDIRNIQLYNTALSRGQVSSVFMMDMDGLPPINGGVLKSHGHSENEPTVDEKNVIGVWAPERSSNIVPDQSFNGNHGQFVLYPNQITIQNNTSITVDVLSPTSYLIDVSSLNQDRLVFNDNFDKNWRAVTNGKILDRIQTSESRNEWKIEENDNLIKIEFLPQHDMTLSSIVSLSILPVIFSITFISKHYKKR